MDVVHRHVPHREAGDCANASACFASGFNADHGHMRCQQARVVTGSLVMVQSCGGQWVAPHSLVAIRQHGLVGRVLWVDVTWGENCREWGFDSACGSVLIAWGEAASLPGLPAHVRWLHGGESQPTDANPQQHVGHGARGAQTQAGEQGNRGVTVKNKSQNAACN